MNFRNARYLDEQREVARIEDLKHRLAEPLPIADAIKRLLDESYDVIQKADRDALVCLVIGCLAIAAFELARRGLLGF